MKNVGTQIMALMLVVWYCLSIIGFGVHTCSASNRSFITNFISGVACEDVHPSEQCKASCCSGAKHNKCCGHLSVEVVAESHSAGAVMVTDETCCHNDYQQIVLTGSGQSNASEQSFVPVTLLALYTASSFDFTDLAYSKKTQARPLSERGLCAGELRPLLSVWRI